MRTINRENIMKAINKGQVNHSNYRKALALARERLREADFALQCQRAGAEVVEPEADHALARIKFIGANYLVDFPSGEVRREGLDEEPLPYDRIIILHYLVHARGAELTGELISFQQIPDGWLYYPAFRKRTTSILARTFRGEVEDFMKAGLAVAAVPSALGQYALEIRALPKVSCHLIMWPGDDELDTDFSCVFDRSITDYLPAEDITVLAGVITSRLVQNSKRGPR